MGKAKENFMDAPNSLGFLGPVTPSVKKINFRLEGGED